MDSSSAPDPRVGRVRHRRQPDHHDRRAALRLGARRSRGAGRLDRSPAAVYRARVNRRWLSTVRRSASTTRRSAPGGRRGSNQSTAACVASSAAPAATRSSSSGTRTIRSCGSASPTSNRPRFAGWASSLVTMTPPGSSTRRCTPHAARLVGEPFSPPLSVGVEGERERALVAEGRVRPREEPVGVGSPEPDPHGPERWVPEAEGGTGVRCGPRAGLAAAGGDERAVRVAATCGQAAVTGTGKRRTGRRALEDPLDCAELPSAASGLVDEDGRLANVEPLHRGVHQANAQVGDRTRDDPVAVVLGARQIGRISRGCPESLCELGVEALRCGPTGPDLGLGAVAARGGGQARRCCRNQRSSEDCRGRCP